jgi:hypothetical protein
LHPVRFNLSREEEVAAILPKRNKRRQAIFPMWKPFSGGFVARKQHRSAAKICLLPRSGISRLNRNLGIESKEISG